MYLGKIVEMRRQGRIYAAPAHPYTQAADVRGAGARSRYRGARQRIILKGDLPTRRTRLPVAASAPVAPSQSTNAPGSIHSSTCWRPATGRSASASERTLERHAEFVGDVETNQPLARHRVLAPPDSVLLHGDVERVVGVRRLEPTFAPTLAASRVGGRHDEFELY